MTASDTPERCPECGQPGRQGYGEVQTGFPGPPGSRLAYWLIYDCASCDHTWSIQFDSGPLVLSPDAER